MSKLALINRQYKREKLVAKYAKKRAALEAMVANSRMSDEDRYAARLKLQQLPRNANPTRLRNRCVDTIGNFDDLKIVFGFRNGSHLRPSRMRQACDEQGNHNN